MPTQAHLYIGIPVNSPDDLVRAAAHFKVRLPPKSEWGDEEAWDDAFSGVSIRIEKETHTPSVYLDSDVGVWAARPYKNKKTGELGDSYMLLGVPLTSRYSPAIVDEGWDRGGRSEPFVLDLDRLLEVREQVREVWPEAEILMLDTMH